MRRLLPVVLLLAASFAVAQNQSSSSSANPAALPQLERFDVGMVDATQAEPCVDFYKYACGKWMAANPIPPDQVWWSKASPLRLWNETVLRQTLEQTEAPSANRTAGDQRIGDYYYACMNEKQIDANSAAELKPELDRIAALQSKKEISAEVAHLNQVLPDAWDEGDDQSPGPMVGFTGQPDFANVHLNVAFVDQAGMGLPGRDFYLKDDARSQEIRSKYAQHIANMFKLAGEEPGAATADANAVLVMETEMAKAMMDPVTRRDPRNVDHPMSLEQLQALTPSYDWATYLKLVNAPASPHYNVNAPEYMQALEKMIQEHPLGHWQAYLRWHMLHGLANYLGTAFGDENFDFYGRTLSGAQQQQPRWRRCVRSTDTALGEALGQAYAQRAFPPASKARVLKMVKDIEREMGQDIQAQDWMAAATKQQALTKLQAVMNKIGYPDHWRDYSQVQITRSSYLADAEQANAFEFERWVHKIDQPLDRTEWGMTPPTINAYEDPQTNTINFPAGILQPPFFDPSQDDAANYGAAGVVMGHELIHGFDDQGRKFDADGNLRDWWTAADAKAYVERGKCISDEYTQEVPEAGVKQNGLLTQGEDTADNGGAHLSYLALQDDLRQKGKSITDKDAQGFTKAQEYFIAYADVWCANIRPQIARVSVLTNPHSLPRYRVNNVVSNMPEFWKAFSCHKDQPMVRANACRIW